MKLIIPFGTLALMLAFASCEKETTPEVRDPNSRFYGIWQEVALLNTEIRTSIFPIRSLQASFHNAQRCSKNIITDLVGATVTLLGDLSF
ncbi:hypothetical protein MKQ68_24520 [Chitinophaga horti]|uniref:Lipocalin-like domain-containing protein n=1 Tax=Chitinophaga horti TaxID=2920382 RepID=A0ABY6J0S0_9BACT|nr:hypothetical protein [Chitinophaga horti]UYQ93252.1 hypothetical protein MKQ68_24520 [Chitinophaga horti]